MLGKILGSGQLGKLVSFVSPAFFDVMPARALMRRSKQLIAYSRDGERIRRLISERASTLETVMPQIRLTMHHQRSETGLPTDPSIVQWRGAQVAELYFRQLFIDGPTLLDLRTTAWSGAGKDLLWSPAAWVAEWSPEFIQPLREIYCGFYTHDDARFQRGLAALDLSHSEDLFRAQFGGNQERVRFEVPAFIDIFHRVFERCKAARTSLHPDFLPLGIYLAALYDYEQELGASVDVASAFARATQPPTQDQHSARTGAV